MNAYPQDIRPLTALRFVAAFWLLTYHFRHHLGFDFGANGLIENGNLGVDLFFILSGFILTHVYVGEMEAGTYSHRRFLWLRLARIYPLHFVTLLAFVLLVAAGSVAGVTPAAQEAFRWQDLPAHLFLVHAWGTAETVGWNFPSWSVSAEWFAYIFFPVFAGAFLKFARRPASGLAVALALFAAMFAVLDPLSPLGFTDMTAAGGVLRIIPSFCLGVALYLFGRAYSAPAWAAWPIALAGTAWTVGVCLSGASVGWAWPGLLAVIYGLGEAAKHGREGAMGGRTAVYLGEVSYALYMVHLLVDVVFFFVAERLGVTAASAEPARLAALAGVFALSIAAAIVAHHAVERPARTWLRDVAERRFLKPRTAAP